MPRLIADDLLAFTRRATAAALARARATRPCAAPWPLAVDATAGNGNDTEHLARYIGPNGLVLAFDIQEKALENTRQRLERGGLLPRVRLINDSHANIPAHLPQNSRPAIAMFNLGFLPGGPPRLTTLPQSSLAALNALAAPLIPQGLITAHCYTGQEHGPEEAEAVNGWMSALPWQSWRVARYDFCNKPGNYEVLYLAEKIAE